MTGTTNGMPSAAMTTAKARKLSMATTPLYLTAINAVSAIHLRQVCDLRHRAPTPGVVFLLPSVGDDALGPRPRGQVNPHGGSCEQWIK